MQTIDNPQELTYWIAHDATGTVVQYGVINAGLSVSTGQPYLDSFTTELNFLNQLRSYGIDVDSPEFQSGLLAEVVWAQQATVDYLLSKVTVNSWYGGW